MTTDQTDAQAAHAEIFGKTGLSLVAAIGAFVDGLPAPLTPGDGARLLLAASVAHLLRTEGSAVTLAALRVLADGIEAGRPVAN